MANTYTEHFKFRMPNLGDLGWDDEVNDNVKISDFAQTPVIRGNRVVEGCTPTDGGNLDIDVAAGTVVVAGTQYDISADTLTCSGSEKNYLFVDDTGTLYCTTTAPAGDYVALALVDAGAVSIDRFSDVRAMAPDAQSLAIDYTPQYYELDETEDKPINKHLSGIDERIYIVNRNRNYLDNGDFFISERNSSFTVNATTIPTIDRWVVSSGDGVASISQAYAGLNQYPGLNFRPIFCMRFNQTTASTTGAGMFQHFPSVYYLAGQTVTVLWDVFNNSGSDVDCKFSIEQCFGSGGSATVGIVGTTETIVTGGWSHFSQTIDIPDIYDKTVVWGSDYFRFHFLIDSTSTFDIYPSNFRLYPGSNIQRGEIVSNEEQRLRCLPYYCRGFERLVGVVYTPNGGCRFSPLYFPEKMAMTPVAAVSATTCIAAGDTAGAYLINTTVTPNILNTTTRRIEIRGISDYVQYQACGTVVYLGCDAFTWAADTGY